ncbi:unnamed protein product [Rotaria sp. Silwood2]|nr:unnamed protein product [Rotaria sp. Silwood2]CAF3350434.1 unnamed protein product [Rotaria sp. Silwood2]CAF4436827.1 unnamed protein product [Rotaria sp. Silwood2]CAF4466213.1 unnamed protein product [Rotaria sp. Silwood2]
MTEHIDNNRIHNDPRYRFDYVSKFLNFTQNDITLLNSLAPIIFPRIPVLVDNVYRKLFSYDITKDYFLIRNQGFENFAATKDNNLTLDSAQMTYRKDMLSMYLKRILTQTEWNDGFLQYLSQIGQIHASKNGAASINVDYIHINIVFGYIEHLLVDTLWYTETIDEKTKHDMIMAVNKLFWIQNDIFTMHYGMSTRDKSFSVDETKIKPKCCWLFN